jgi:Cys-rich protein (TIGR01571 family)
MGDMQESLFGCLSDISTCIIGWLIPCYLAATTKAALDERECTFCDCLCAPNEYQTRQSIRAKYGMAYQPLNDCLCWSVFSSCFVCQDAREVKARGGGK